MSLTRAATGVRRAVLIASLCLLLGACSLAPRYERPEMDIPAQWRSVDLGAAPLRTDWWTRFEDPVLTALIEQALRKNQDLARSLAEIDAAAAQMGVATSALAPLISGSGAAGSQGASEATANTAPFSSNGLSRSHLNYQLQASASWELDLWGRLRNIRSMQTDVLMNTALSHEALRLTVAGETAKGYFSLLALDSQLETARRTLKSRESSFGIYTSRYQQGDITELDWQRARAEVETARVRMHSSVVAVDQAEAALAVLIGRSPREIIAEAMPRGTSIERLPAPPALPAGLPSELLLRRPDVRAAEFLIMAYNANIGAARAEYFPSLSLTGTLGTLSAEAYKLFSGPAGAWSYGISGTVPLLDFGRVWYKVKGAEAQKQAAEATYRKAVQTAFEDLRTSLTSQREAGAVVQSQLRQVESLRRAVEIARLQYDNGYTDYLTVLDAERQLFSAELEYAAALRDRLNAVVGVCMALGGGWQDPDVRPGVFGDTAPLLEGRNPAARPPVQGDAPQNR